VIATIDFLPTFARLCGFEVPDDRVIDGQDQTDLLLGKRDSGRPDFYFDRAGVRSGQWKYLKADAHFHKYAVEDDRPAEEELYDLESDLGESRNLAKVHPEKVAEMRRLMRAIENAR
jgi:arylsulfatase A-like enzyme